MITSTNLAEERAMAVQQNYIAGEWIGGGAVNRNINPSNIDDVVGEYARADRGDVERAVAAAAAAFPKWSLSTPQQRFDVLDRIGTELLARRDELGRLLSREEGKTLAEGVGEVTRAGAVFKFFAGEALRLAGELLPSTRSGLTVEITREPIGVVAVIAPWNFPMAIPAWKIAPAPGCPPACSTSSWGGGRWWARPSSHRPRSRPLPSRVPRRPDRASWPRR